MYAALDLGSNSVRLSLAKADAGSLQIVHRQRLPLALAAGLDRRGQLAPATLDATLAALRTLGATVAQWQPQAVRAVGTATLRALHAPADFLARAGRAFGHPLEVLSVEMEARLIYQGTAQILATPGERRAVLDIGGGASELLIGHGAALERAEAYPLGTVRQALSFFGSGRLDSASFGAAIASARHQLSSGAPLATGLPVYGASGTLRALSRLLAANGWGQGDISLPALQALRTRCEAAGSLGALRAGAIALGGLEPERLLSVIGGLSLALAFMTTLDCTRMQPTEAGLRMGVLWDLHQRQQGRGQHAVLLRELAGRAGADSERHPAHAYWLQAEQDWWDEA